MSGLLASARAMVVRCCSPPDIMDGTCSARSRKPTRASSFKARFRREVRVPHPARTIGSSTFSTAVSPGRRLNV